MPFDEDERARLERMETALHRLLEVVEDFYALWRHEHHPRVPVSATLHIQTGGTMPGTITVDTTNATVEVEFADDHGDVTAAPASSNGSGAIVVTFASDNAAVLTVGASAVDPSDAGISAPLTPVTVGTANLSVAVTNADGSPLLEADGVTPFPVPAVVNVAVGAGPANELLLTVNG